jgi:hypothetical protein
MGEVRTIGLDQRTMVSNAIRGHLAELGIISAKGRNGTTELFKIMADEKDGRIPAAARFSLDVLARQHAAIAPYDGRGVYRAKSRNASETRARMRSRSRSRPLPPPVPGLHSSS